MVTQEIGFFFFFILLTFVTVFRCASKEISLVQVFESGKRLRGVGL